MKRIVVLLLITVCLLLASCQKSPELISPELSDIELGSTEYDRVGEGVISLVVPVPIPLDEAFEQAEMVVKVQITDLYGTYNFKSSSAFGATVFSARILETYNDCNAKAGEMILIHQLGTPGMSVEGFPLCKIGDVFLVCLENIDRTIFEEDYPETVYKVINGMHGILQVISNKGQEYIVNRAYTKYCEEIASSRVGDNVRDDVLETLFDYDIVLRMHAYCPFEVYDEDIVVEYLEGLK